MNPVSTVLCIPLPRKQLGWQQGCSNIYISASAPLRIYVNHQPTNGVPQRLHRMTRSGSVQPLMSCTELTKSDAIVVRNYSRHGVNASPSDEVVVRNLLLGIENSGLATNYRISNQFCNHSKFLRLPMPPFSYTLSWNP